jgi:hypothetical protein
MSFLLNWWSPSTTNNEKPNYESDEERYYLQHNHISADEEAKLPPLPFVYDKTKCGVFTCTHPAFPYVAVISELDFKMLEYLNTVSLNQIPLMYRNHAFHEIMEQCIYSDSMNSVKAFCDMTHCDYELYYGVMNEEQKLMELVSALDGARSDKRFKRMRNTIKDITMHFDKLYGNRQSIVFF